MGNRYKWDDCGGARAQWSPTGTAPTDIAIARGGKYAYVANCGGASVTAVELADLTEDYDDSRGYGCDAAARGHRCRGAADR